MESHIEQKLIKRAQKGQVEAFEKLIILYEKQIYAICLKMLHKEQDAYDASQEVCLKIWRQLPHFKGDSKLSTWIYRVATNQCLDILRKHKNKTEVSIYQTHSETNEEWLIDLPSTEKSIEEMIGDQELSFIINAALSELKPEQKEIIILRDIMGCRYDEISKILGLTEGTVKSRLSRSRLALKKILLQNKEPFKSYFRHIKQKEGIL